MPLLLPTPEFFWCFTFQLPTPKTAWEFQFSCKLQGLESSAAPVPGTYQGLSETQGRKTASGEWPFSTLYLWWKKKEKKIRPTSPIAQSLALQKHVAASFGPWALPRLTPFLTFCLPLWMPPKTLPCTILSLSMSHCECLPSLQAGAGNSYLSFTSIECGWFIPL